MAISTSYPPYDPVVAAQVEARIDALCVNTIRCLAIDAVQKAKSGHPGMPLGAAPMAYVLFSRILKFHAASPGWFDRDRFVLSAGHGSILLYTLLHLCGYGVSLSDLKQFRQWNSKTPGHPERGLTPGVEVTTGPLGQGFANGVGMAIAEASLAARYNRPSYDIVNHYTFGILSDGDLMEGISSEAAALAGHLRLGKLVYLYDYNRVLLSTSLYLVSSDDVLKRFQSCGWHTQFVDDANDLEKIEQALRTAMAERSRPSLVVVRSHIGYGAPHLQDTFQAHGAPLGDAEVALTKEHLGRPVDRFFEVPAEVREHFRAVQHRGALAEEHWNRLLSAYAGDYPALATELLQVIRQELPENWHESIPSFDHAEQTATRSASGIVLNAIAAKMPSLLGGSADLSTSTKTALKDQGDFESPDTYLADRQGASGGVWSYAGRTIHFGVREHAMGGCLNGMAAHGGVVPFGSTFLIFSDYMRPAIRLAAIMGLQVIYVFTHDSIGLGEDGTTHQPVEHLASLRAMPGLNVIRPCDANETAVAWRVALETRDRPTALILTRQKVPTLNRTVFASAENLRRGAYVISEAPGRGVDCILIASGSEVHLAMQAQTRLRERRVSARVVSMPSWELFEESPVAYRRAVLDPAVTARISIEAASAFGWRRYVGDAGDSIAVDTFGSSAPGNMVMAQYGFSVDAVVSRVMALLSRTRSTA
jgi:transketolase